MTKTNKNEHPFSQNWSRFIAFSHFCPKLLKTFLDFVMICCTLHLGEEPSSALWAKPRRSVELGKTNAAQYDTKTEAAVYK